MSEKEKGVFGFPYDEAFVLWMDDAFGEIDVALNLSIDGEYLAAFDRGIVLLVLLKYVAPFVEKDDAEFLDSVDDVSRKYRKLVELVSKREPSGRRVVVEKQIYIEKHLRLVEGLLQELRDNVG